LTSAFRAYVTMATRTSPVSTLSRLMTSEATDIRVANFDSPIFADESIIIATSVSRSQPGQQSVAMITL